LLFPKILNNVTSLYVIMRNTIQKKLWEVVNYGGEDYNNCTKESCGEVREVEDTSKATAVRSYRESNFEGMSKEEKLEWLAGYIDGDGSIYTVWRYDGRYGSEFWGRNVRVGSTDYSAVYTAKLIMDCVGISGRIFSASGNKGGTINGRVINSSKDMFIYMIQSKYSLRKFVREFANRFKTNMKIEKFSELALSLGLHNYVYYEPSQFTIPWIAGFFEAEGTAAVELKKDSRNGRCYRTIRLMISQKDDVLLNKIRKFLVDEYGLEFKLYYNQYGVGMIETYGVRNATKFIDIFGRFILTDNKISRILLVKDTIDTWNYGKERITWTDSMIDLVKKLYFSGKSYRYILSRLNSEYGVNVSYGSLANVIYKIKKNRR